MHHLARELNGELSGKTVSALQFDSSAQRVLIDVGDIRVVWELHPNKGQLTRTAPLYPLPDSATLPKKARVSEIYALHDERIVMIELSGERKENATQSVAIELLTNQWNAFALDHAGKILRVLKLRESGRTFRRGQNYVPPEHPVEDRVEYRSPLNESLSADQLETMLAEAPLPAVLDGQPYPHHLWSDRAIRFDTLLAAFASLAGTESNEEILNELQRRVHAVKKKIERLEGERTKAQSEEQKIREQADVLMAYATTITKGVAKVILPGFSGGEVTIELQPTLTPIENAHALYDEARKQQRAQRRVPELVANATTHLKRLEDLLARATRGELSDKELAGIKEKPTVRPQEPGERLPYRRYRTTGGLEVRVGRNAKSNDELTLHHSSPRDIWLHARHVGGAHVVLRWNDAEANPPQLDIVEAAILAAVHSAARTSRMVPVDYTRRKYVRKPRRSPPGTVMIERSKTVFVEPSAETEQRLREV